ATAVWRKTVDQLRACSRGRAECVVLWTGALDDASRVDEAIHPKHTATPTRYLIDGDWLHRLHVKLYRTRRAIRVQVHVHAGSAFHSITDDRYPAVGTEGF